MLRAIRLPHPTPPPQKAVEGGTKSQVSLRMEFQELGIRMANSLRASVASDLTAEATTGTQCLSGLYCHFQSFKESGSQPFGVLT